MVSNKLAYDTAFHLFFARIIGENSHIVPAVYNNLYKNFPITYPYFCHWILSFIPGKFIYTVSRYFSSLCDTIILLCIYYFCQYLVDIFHVSPNTPTISCIVYIIHPSLARYTNGPRIAFFSPRVFAQLIFTLHIFSFFAYSISGNFVYIIFSSIMNIIGLLSSKFYMQVIASISIFMIIYDPSYALCILAPLLFGMIFKKIGMIKIITFSVQHSLYYKNFLQEAFLHPLHKNIKEYIVGFLKNKNAKEIIAYINGSRHPFNTLFFFFPEIVIAIIFIPLNPLPQFSILLIPLAATLLASILFEQKYFMFLGDGERYLQFSAPLSCIVSSIFVFSHSYAALYMYCFYGLCVHVYSLMRIKRVTKNYFGITDENKNFFVLLDSMPEGKIFPIGKIEWYLLLLTNKTIISAPTNLSENYISSDEYNLLKGNEPFPSSDFSAVIDYFQPRYIVGTTYEIDEYVNNYLKDKNDFYKHTKAILQNGTLIAFEVVTQELSICQKGYHLKLSTETLIDNTTGVYHENNAFNRN